MPLVPPVTTAVVPWGKFHPGGGVGEARVMALATNSTHTHTSLHNPLPTQDLRIFIFINGMIEAVSAQPPKRSSRQELLLFHVLKAQRMLRPMCNNDGCCQQHAVNPIDPEFFFDVLQ
jgi:hypothetical protein